MSSRGGCHGSGSFGTFCHDNRPEGTRAEEGNLFFDWSRSVEDPDEYVLVEVS